ncbi:hypothetical protein Purlil1_14213 [Purpureocillium lilacinum]|uniref:Uncharacterized protein n=1 Tax=Purpureocillium lilacinum TaxID=33203 RepID=A0ABR0BBY1_PURLI|nr:hypothetical protein Purlil1_14213 [Purpureocillium lilacinum]
MVSSREKDPRKLAIDALSYLTNNIPDWQRRLDGLAGQIDWRQAELATVGGEQPNASSAGSLRNKGSSESLRPKDDGVMQTNTDSTTQFEETPQDDIPAPAVPLPSSLENCAAPHKHPREAVLAAHSGAGRPARKKPRSSSMASVDGPPTTNLTRRRVIVYYDKYVQAFFDELVRFLSTGQNLVRQARRAAKIAQIKRLAEMEMPVADSNPGDDDNIYSLPSFRYSSTQRLGPVSVSKQSQRLLICETLDGGLESVQRTCVRGANQFLRNGHCDDGIQNIRSLMGKVLETSAGELERMQHMEPELAAESGDNKPMPRGPSASRRTDNPNPWPRIQSSIEHPAIVAKREPGKPLALSFVGSLEADTNMGAD